MKTKYFLSVGCAVLLLFSATAYGAQGLYFGVSLGMTTPNDSEVDFSELDENLDLSVDVKSESGIGLGLALGYGFSDTMRGECEFAYQSNDLDKMTASYMGQSASVGMKGDITSMAFLVNGYYDFVNMSAFTPFMSAGIGFAKVETEFTGLEDAYVDLARDEDDTALAYQIGAGLGWAVNEKLTLDAKYRYFATEDLDFEGADFEYSSHNFYVGIRMGL